MRAPTRAHRAPRQPGDGRARAPPWIVMKRWWWTPGGGRGVAPHLPIPTTPSSSSLTGYDYRDEHRVYCVVPGLQLVRFLSVGRSRSIQLRSGTVSGAGSHNGRVRVGVEQHVRLRFQSRCFRLGVCLRSWHDPGYTGGLSTCADYSTLSFRGDLKPQFVGLAN